MDEGKLQRRLEDLFDQAIFYHAFVDYMRDYEVIAHVISGRGTEQSSVALRYLFKHCVEVSVDSAITPDTWARSLDDRYIGHEWGHDITGFVWGSGSGSLRRT